VIPEYPETAVIALIVVVSRAWFHDGFGHTNFMLARRHDWTHLTHIAANETLGKIWVMSEEVMNILLSIQQYWRLVAAVLWTINWLDCVENIYATILLATTMHILLYVGLLPLLLDDNVLGCGCLIATVVIITKPPIQPAYGWFFTFSCLEMLNKINIPLGIITYKDFIDWDWWLASSHDRVDVLLCATSRRYLTDRLV
jgi:hypothetical protein